MKSANFLRIRKHKLQKALLHLPLSQTLPHAITEHVLATEQPNTHPVWRLCFLEKTATQPIISQLINQFNLRVNILQANVEYIKKHAMGIMIIAVDGDKNKLQAAMQHLQKLGVQLRLSVMSQTTLSLLLSASLATIYMVVVSSLIATLIGLPLGIILYITRKGNILEQRTTHQILAAIVNITRSIPFIILMIAVIPFTRLLIGTSIGTNAAIVPLSLAAMPFIARIVENALLEVNKGLIEAATAMGATSWQIIIKVLIPEAHAWNY